jgi:acyl-coenzyme A synthetase/AMP-(fatty) acid ligase
MLMHQLIHDGAVRRPNQICFRWVDRDRALTFAEAAEATEVSAGMLHHLGVKKGDRVTIFAHNGMDYLVSMFACWRIGAISALVNVKFADELDYYLDDHKPSLVIYTHDMGEAPPRSRQRRASFAWTVRKKAPKACRICSPRALPLRPIPATRQPSRIFPIRRERPADPRARVSRTNRRCAQRVA